MIEAEYSVIGGAIIGEDFRNVMLSELEQKHFKDNLAAEIFGMMAESESIDEVVIFNKLGQSQKVMNEVATAMESAAGIDLQMYREYIAIIISNWQKREAQEVAGETFRSAGESDDANQVIGEAIERLESLTTQEEKNTFSAQEVCKATLADIDTRFNHDDEIFGLSTGFKDLDEKSGGLDVGNATCIAGRPGSGKTTLAMNIAENVAIEQKKKVLFLNLEMDEVELGRRLMASLGKVNLADIKNPKNADQSVWHGITAASNMLKSAEGYLTIINCHGYTTQKIMQVVKSEYRRNQFDLLCLDYAGLVNVGENRATGLGHLVKSIRNYSKKKFHSLILSQVNRACENRPDKRPIAADLRESGDIEQDMDNILFVYRDEMYNEDTQDKGIAEVIGRKSRHGSCGTTRLGSNLAQSRFYELGEYQS